MKSSCNTSKESRKNTILDIPGQGKKTKGLKLLSIWAKESTPGVQEAVILFYCLISVLNFIYSG